MAETAQFTIGAEASCSDGAVGEVTRVIVDPVAEAVTHLVVGLEHGRDSGRLVPLDLIESTAGQIQLGCTRAEFGKLEPAEETRFIPATSAYAGYGAGQVSYWPYYGLGAGSLGAGAGAGGMGLGSMSLGLNGGSLSQTVTYDSIPPGEVDVHRGDHVEATDGSIGRVQGLVIDRGSGHVTHVLLQEGHLWGRREVAIPVSAVASAADGILLTITKQQVKDLPPVDASHPGAGAAGGRGSG